MLNIYMTDEEYEKWLYTKYIREDYAMVMVFEEFKLWYEKVNGVKKDDVQ